MRPSATRVCGLNLGVIGEMSELRLELKDGIVLQTYVLEHLQLPQLHWQEMDAVIREL